jgi:integration host factor subunit beta
MSEERVPTLTKKDVARRVAELQSEPIYKCEPWVNAVIVALRDLMLDADPEVRIELRDFGVFEVKKTKAKPKARNPKTNETVFIPSRRKTHFKPSKLMKQEFQKPLVDLGYKVPDGSADSHPGGDGQAGVAPSTNGVGAARGGVA